MRKFIAALVLLLAGALVPAVVAAPVNADTPGCVSASEWDAVQRGWAMQSVHHVFDTVGQKIEGSNGYQTRKYPKCSTNGATNHYIWYKWHADVDRWIVKDKII